MTQNSWTFPILVDGVVTIKDYGLLNPRYDDQPERAGLPYPATILIDSEGVVRFKNVWEDYKKRTTPQTILEELDKLR